MDLITLAMAKKYSDSKGGYVESGKTILPNTTVDLATNEPFLLPKLELTSGATYLVAFDGVEGEYTAFAEEGTVVVGSIEPADPFAVLNIDFGDVEGVQTILVSAHGGTHTISISTTETIHPIDPKFIPGAVLPVVELSTWGAGKEIALTVEESALLTTLAEQETPCIIRIVIDGKCAMSLSCSYIYDEVPVYATNVLGVNYMLMYSADTGLWTQCAIQG